MPTSIEILISARDEASAVLANVNRQVQQTALLFDQNGKILLRAIESNTRSMGQLATSIDTTNRSVGTAGEGAKGLDFNFRTLGRSIGLGAALMTSMGAATGGMGTTMLRATSTVSSLIGAFAIGGPIVGGLTAAVTGLAFALSLTGNQAKRVEEAWRDATISINAARENAAFLREQLADEAAPNLFAEMVATAKWQALFDTINKGIVEGEANWKIWEAAALHAAESSREPSPRFIR